MKKVLEKLMKLNVDELDPNLLKNVLSRFDFSSVDYSEYIQGVSLEEYSRVVIMDAPIRVFLTIWPAEYTLSPHQHNNFWGYIVVLKGLLTETAFVYDPEDAQLSCHPPKSFRKGEVIFEPLNVIHHLQNPSPSKHLITAHFYYPAVYDYNGVMIFDIRNRRLGEMNEKAPGVSWNLPPDHYRRIEENAFSVVNLW